MTGFLALNFRTLRVLQVPAVCSCAVYPPSSPALLGIVLTPHTHCTVTLLPLGPQPSVG